MPVVTKDATSGKWLPQGTAEYTSLLGGTTFSNPAFLWLLQMASGNAADSIGACTLTAANTPSYQTAVTGWSTKAVSWADLGTARFDNTTTPPDGSTTSLAFFGYFYVSATPAASRFMASMTDQAISIAVSSGGKIEGFDSSIGVGTETISDSVVRPYFIVYNRALSTCKLFYRRASDGVVEVVDCTYVSSSGAHTVIGAYPTLTTPAGGCLYAAQWTGSAAEFTDTQATTLLDRFANGPAISSITISPSTATISTLGSTQSLTATSTRVDTSTVVNTNAVTWVSNNPSVATVNSAGVVTAVANGTANITCTFTSLNATTAASNTSIITVSAGAGATVPLPVVGVDVPDHQALALARLPEQDKNKPNIAALLNVCVTPVVALESALWQLLTQRRVTTAIGVQLDALGKLVGQPRNGLSDVDYQTYIAARISANRSSGLTEDLLRVAKTLINNTSAVITASYGGAGTVIVTVTGVTRTDAQGAALASFEQTAIAAGIRVVVQYTSFAIGSTFRYDVGPGYDVGHYATGIG